MFRKDPKLRFGYLIFTLLVFAVVSAMSFYYFIENKDGMRLIGGILFGVMAIFQAGDLYVFNKGRKKIVE